MLLSTCRIHQWQPALRVSVRNRTTQPKLRISGLSSSYWNIYFKKNLPAFITECGFTTPNQLFNSIENIPQKHQIWIEKIRSIVSDRIVCEEERVPSYDALWRHWLRTCWISQMWGNSVAVYETQDTVGQAVSAKVV